MSAYHDLLRGELYSPAAHQFDDRFEGAITNAAIAWRVQDAERTFPDDPVGEEPIVVGAVRYLDYAGEEMKDRSMLAVVLP
jgi:hypothetical protein